jgi:glycosyltransferase involved in cell wall biosynthesis
VRIAILYDCLYPYTVGGAERWYRDLAERLAVRNHVTYVTRRQWSQTETPDAPRGTVLVAVSGGRQLYTASGRRKVTPPLRFAVGTFWHLLRHRRRYDVIHTCGFPYLSLIAARLACAIGGPPIVTDWIEVWTRSYWVEYLGRVGGRIGAWVQALCIRLTDRAFTLSQLHADRLKEEGYSGRPTVLKGLYAGPAELLPALTDRDPMVVYVGRHIREKRVAAIPAAVALARDRIPALRATIFGDGPERSRVIAEVQRLGLQDVVTCPGFVPWEDVDAAIRRSMCLLLPSQREGYGLVIVEASARGTPSIVVRDPDNAATELVDSGKNGLVVDSAEPEVLASAIVAVHAADGLADSTRTWFRNNAHRLTIDASIAQVERVYAEITDLRS